MPAITVIVCTHNPKPRFFNRTLDALRRQTLATSDWGLIVVDNNSNIPVSPEDVARAHPLGKLLQESATGKVNAMATAFQQSDSNLLVTVDDDNLLEPDYLAKAVDLASHWQSLGVWSASITGEFETPAPPWAKPHLHLVAVRQLDQDYWGNQKAPHVFPIGAGMVFRRVLAERFLEELRSDRFPIGLCRAGQNTLAGTEDTLFGYLAIEQGLGCGAFRDLKMKHLIPSQRLTLDYMKNISYSLGYSHTVLGRIYEDQTYLPPTTGQQFVGWCRTVIRRWNTDSPQSEQINIAAMYGRQAGMAANLAAFRSHIAVAR